MNIFKLCGLLKENGFELLKVDYFKIDVRLGCVCVNIISCDQHGRKFYCEIPVSRDLIDGHHEFVEKLCCDKVLAAYSKLKRDHN